MAVWEEQRMKNDVFKLMVELNKKLIVFINISSVRVGKPLFTVKFQKDINYLGYTLKSVTLFS